MGILAAAWKHTHSIPVPERFSYSLNKSQLHHSYLPKPGFLPSTDSFHLDILSNLQLFLLAFVYEIHIV